MGNRFGREQRKKLQLALRNIKKLQKVSKVRETSWKSMVKQLKSNKEIENIGFLLAYTVEFS